MPPSLFRCVVVASLLLFYAQLGFAATFNIANGDLAGLISAINTANSNNQNDTINLASGGDYVLTAVDNSNNNGLPIIAADNGHTVTINGNNATIQRTTSGGPVFLRILDVTGSVTVSNLIFANASIQNGGAAFRNASGRSTLQSCTFHDNVAFDQAGGAVSNDTGTLIVETCTFQNNTISWANNVGPGGGAIYNSTGSVTVTDCNFSANHASGSNTGRSSGGALYNDGDANNHDGSITVTNCTFDQNTSTFEGGAIRNIGMMTIRGCTFSGNSVRDDFANSGNGGAISNVIGTLDVGNCTFSGNTATHGNGEGGAIFNSSPSTRSTSLTVTSCTFSGNTATNGSGIYDEALSTPTATVTIRNTILNNGAGNLVKSGANSSITSQGYNLSSDSGGGFLVGTADQINTDPKVDPLGLQHNGAANKTIALIYGSPAIDKGNSFGLTTDERGVARPVDNPSIANATGGDGSDIGAYEAPSDALQAGPTYVVNTLSDHDDGTCGGADCTLREAINQVNAVQSTASLTITFSVLGTIILSASPFELDITRNVTISGPNARNLVISGGSTHRILDVVSGTVSISGVTIRDGNFVTDSGLTRQGGAVYNSANLTFSDCAFINNTAVGVASGQNGGSGGAGQGGAIYNANTLALNRCTFSGNSATGAAGHTFTSQTLFAPGGNGGAGQGGAVFNDSAKTLSITNCTFSGNTVTGGNGGSGNSSAAGASGGNADGGAVCNLGTMNVTSATVSGNTGTGGAGAVFGFQRHGPNGSGNGGFADISGSSSHVANTIVAANSGSTAPDAEGTFISSGYNLIGIGDQSSGFSGTTSDQVGTTAAPINPQLGSLRDYGGPTDTIAPLGNSPAIDQGNSFGFTTDQRGQPRPFDEPSIPNLSDGTDIGAVETDTQLGPTFVVATTDDHDDGICSVSDCTLREAINAANTASGPNAITFAPGTTGTITVDSARGTLNITSDTTIIGPGARTLAVSGNSFTRMFFVSAGTSTISGLTIRDGFLSGPSQVVVTGGAILNLATLTLNDCTLSNNHAAGGDDNGNFGGAGGTVRGGAIYNSAALTLSRCTFTGNGLLGGRGGLNGSPNGTGGSGGAAQGGALFNDTGGVLSINNCTLNGNAATGGAGGNGHFAGPGGNGSGAVFNLGTMTVTAATVSGNSGTGGFPGIGSNPFPGRGSGGLAVAAGSSAVANSIVAANTGNNGGGIDVDGMFTSNGYNLVGTTTHSTGFTATGDQTGTDTAKLDPKLGSLKNNGGATDTMMLLINSPALDKGKSFGLAYDQRGLLRTIDSPVFANASGGDGTDIGAVEFYPLNGTDTDGDGMPDDFETFFGFNPGDPSDANQDADGDGLTNLQEFLAGTNPRDPASGLRVIAVVRNGNDFTVTFSLAVAGKSYRLERKDALTDASWGSITGVSDLSPTFTGSAQITDPGGASVSKHFYHIRVLP